MYSESLDGFQALLDYLKDPETEKRVNAIVQACCEAIDQGGKIVFFGNGGSASDAQHLCGELVGRFERERLGLPAIALCSDTIAMTAIANDYGYDRVFERQAEALVRAGDVAIGISTSGNSSNVIKGLNQSKLQGAISVGFGGKDGGQMLECCNHALIVRSNSTPRIQEAHIFLGHCICDSIEAYFAQ